MGHNFHEAGTGHSPSSSAAAEIERLRSLLVGERRRFLAERRALRHQCRALRDELAHHIAYHSAYRFRVIDKIHSRLQDHPWLLAVVCFVVSTAIQAVSIARWLIISSLQHAWATAYRTAQFALHGLRVSRQLALHGIRLTLQRIIHRLRHGRNVVRALTRGLVELVFLDSTMSWVRRTHGWSGLWGYASLRLREVLHGPASKDLNDWLSRARPSPRLLNKFRKRTWPADAPRFTVLLCVESDDCKRLYDSLRSLAAQIYPHWQLAVAILDDANERRRMLPDSVRVIAGATFAQALSVAIRDEWGDYLVLMEQGDILEPHALYRFADAALRTQSELLYSDVVSVGENVDEALALEARPGFSYDSLLSHAFISDAFAVSGKTLRRCFGYSPEDVHELLLRVLEDAKSVTHLPEALYRRRTPAVRRLAPGLGAVSEHLRRMGSAGAAHPTDDPLCRDIRFPCSPNSRVAIIIPTKNKGELLRQCVESLERTLPMHLADLCIVDHASNEPATQAYLAELASRHRVLPFAGPFNFSAINNVAVAALGKRYSHYLFLNNDTEALSPGWLEHMLGLADRSDVGIVGAMLLYPDRTVQHAGVIVGLHYGADHAHKFLPAYDANGKRQAGPGGALLATREQSAVTGACLLIRAEVFDELHGFDEQLVVGFGDTDLCLRARELGHKVMLDAQAVLLHHESATRGTHALDPHPEDTKRFRARHLQAILAGDHFYHPHLSRQFPYQLGPQVGARATLPLRTTQIVLPSTDQGSQRDRLAA